MMTETKTIEQIADDFAIDFINRVPHLKMATDGAAYRTLVSGVAGLLHGYDQRLTAAETLLAECQQQAAALATAEFDRQAMAANEAATQRLIDTNAALLSTLQSDRLTPADLRTLANAAEATATILDGPNDDTGGLMELARKVRRLADTTT